MHRRLDSAEHFSDESAVDQVKSVLVKSVEATFFINYINTSPSYRCLLGKQPLLGWYLFPYHHLCAYKHKMVL